MRINNAAGVTKYQNSGSSREANGASLTVRFPKTAQVEFVREGWKQLCKANQSLGARFIRAFVLKQELSAYLTAHEAAGIHMDTECQEIRYDDGIYLLLRKVQGVWYIIDVIITDTPVSFLPVYMVRKVLRGVMMVSTLVFSGWQSQRGRSARKAVIV